MLTNEAFTIVVLLFFNIRSLFTLSLVEVNKLYIFSYFDQIIYSVKIQFIFIIK